MSAAHISTPLRVDLQVAADESIVPGDADWQGWVSAALRAAGHDMSGVVTVRLVTEDESAGLNLSYRDKPGATNVLAFPGPGDELISEQSLAANCNVADEAAIEVEIGDLVICLPIACDEAEQQGKRAVAHLAHLVVHGTLHLIGYDHQFEKDAERMENLEVRILGELGFADPYANPERMSDSRL